MKFMKATLLYVLKDNKILLGEKLRGFGIGKINGIGGKVDPGETVDDAMIRETKEEIGVFPIDAKCVAKLTYYEKFNGEDTKLETYVFITDKIDGKPSKSSEMNPMWFDVDEIPYGKMFGDDEFWLPQVLSGKCVEAEFWFDDDFKIIKQNVKEVENIVVS